MLKIGSTQPNNQAVRYWMETGEKITKESSGNNFINCLHRTDQRSVMDNSDGDSSASAWLQNCGAVWDVMLGYDTKSYDIISIDD